MNPEEVQALGKAVDVAKDYADSIVKGPLSELGSILSDTVGYWRLKNQVGLILKAKKWLEGKGVAPNKLLPDIFVPLLNDGGNVEDETLSDMFASLLACHLDPGQQSLVHPSYSKVLAQLSP
ncbi:MAG TPA: Abi-alpha family protein, partial [Nitrososphaera sp.]|nr:Abi-alpha family protein [Nitrososphaera sp.]